MNDSMTSGCSSLRRGLTLVEMVVSISLVGVAIVAVLDTVGAAKFSQFKIGVSRQGYLLAQDLMTEILLQDYADPVDGLGSFGVSAAEAATGNRSLFDDADDYDAWSASPPVYKDGTGIANLAGWQRSVAVVWANPLDVSQVVGSDQGVKRITVTVTHKGIPAAELVALKTVGLPPLEACCFAGGTCEDLRAEACVTQGGTAQGPKTNCAGTRCPVGPLVLFVVIDPAAATAQEATRQSVMETWGFGVQLIAASALQSDFDTAVAGVDVAYVSEDVDATVLARKLTSATVGVVNEDPELTDEFGFSTGRDYTTATDIRIDVNSHYITSPFTTGWRTVFTSTQPVATLTLFNAPGIEPMAYTTVSGAITHISLAVLQTGARLADGTLAAGRRVLLPWGADAFDATTLNADAQTIMKRAIRWAAGMELVCGDGTCDAGEECTCVADCGAAAAFEQPGVDCADGLDNDCDGAADCADVNCSGDPACVVCGNALCESGEDCNGCATDCPGVTGGPPSGRYCCGNGLVELAEGDGTICDGNY